MCMCDLGLVVMNYLVCKYCKVTHLVQYISFGLLNTLLTPLASSCALSTCKYPLTLSVTVYLLFCVLCVQLSLSLKSLAYFL